MSGSSPLTRGKLDCVPVTGERAGLIPAHAGKTKPIRERILKLAAHPRSRGENVGAARTQRGDSGSSPLTRGKPRDHRPNARLRGLIPAHAGKTRPRRGRRGRRRAHPRSRGENRSARRALTPPSGSSPLTRGKLRRLRSPAAAKGLIPAHAGKTATFSAASMTFRAHPRSRGEN